MKLNIKITALAAGLALVASSAATAGTPYEVYAADQSNSVAGVASRGIDGSFIWVWQGEDVEIQANGGVDAVPVRYDMHEVFPGSLVESVSGGVATGETLGTLHTSGQNFGRLHGMLSDPQGMYMNINMFVTGGPAGGYVGIIDGATKEPVALFQVTKTGHGRSLHMSFWNADGSALLLANLHGRILERINVNRDTDGRITSAEYDLSASLNVGSTPNIVDSASGFNPSAADPIASMVPSTVTGAYVNADLGLTTPSGAARQGAERPANVIVCPIVSSTGMVYTTFGGGGLIVADGNATPMKIVAEYDRATINGAGCGGIESNGRVFLNAGASAAGSGATQSTMTVYSIDDVAIAAGNGGVNMPAPTVHVRDKKNTATIGATDGKASNNSGQLPGKSTRRDAHGMSITADGKYIHQSDRIQNVVEVIDTATGKHVGSYSLERGNACANAAADGVPNKYANDPAPDLMGTTPDGDFMVVALRGPTPVSVSHNAQGACPGVGIIAIRGKGKGGELVTVLRTTNTIDTAPQSAPGGYAYTGNEHSDPHGASIRVRSEDM